MKTDTLSWYDEKTWKKDQSFFVLAENMCTEDAFIEINKDFDTNDMWFATLNFSNEEPTLTQSINKV